MHDAGKMPVTERWARTDGFPVKPGNDDGGCGDRHAASDPIAGLVEVKRRDELNRDRVAGCSSAPGRPG